MTAASEFGSLTTSGGSKTVGPKTLAVGQYTITESAATGWTLANLSCQGGTVSKSGATATIDLKKDDNVVCTYENTKDTGSISLVKKTNGGDDTFAFTGSLVTAVSEFGSLTTSGGTKTVGPKTLAVGQYTITESAATGWTLANLSCQGGTVAKNGATATIDLKKGNAVTCTYENVKDQGSVTLIKQATGGDGTFAFTGSLVTAASEFGSLTTSGGAKTVGPKTLNAGTYTITETALDGWSLNDFHCHGDGTYRKIEPSTIELTIGKGDDITCTFKNKKDEADITLVKETEGGDGTFGFSGSLVTAVGEFASLTTVDGKATVGPKTVTVGTYTITEKTVEGWALANLQCQGGKVTTDGATASITVKKDENVTCTYKNKRDQGSITLVKKTEGGDGTFAFKGSLVDAVSDFASVTTSGGSGTVGPKALNIGSYTITENASEGWKLTGLTCQGGTVKTSGGTATIDLKKSDTVTCTYENAKEGTLKVSKTVPGGSSQSFGFTGRDPSEASLAFSLTSGASQTFTGLGKFTVTESTLAGWKLTGLTCEGGGTVDKASRKIDVDLKPGASVSCVYTNEKETGTIIVRKEAIGGDDKFTFGVTGQSNFVLSKGGSKTFTGLPVGSYTIEELAIPAGWTLKSTSCGKGGSNQVTVNITDGQTVTCVFTNFKEKDERAEDVTKVFVQRRVDNLLTHGPDRARILRRLDEQGQPESLKDGGDGQAMKITGSAGDGQAEATFSTSLSQMRAAAAAASNQKLEGAGLALQDSPLGTTPSTMKQRFDIWVEGQLSTYDDTTGGINREGDFKILYAGADYAVTPGILIGALVQIDRTDEKVNDSDLKGMVSGTGWMMGPYLGAKLQENLFFDARAAWGKSTNDLELSDSVVGARTGSFETDRWLASATLTGNYQWGAFRMSPQVGVAYGNEVSDAYFTSLGQKVDGVDIAIGRLTFGPEFGYTTKLPNGMTIEPHLAVKGIWDFYGDDLKLSTGTVDTEDFRVQVEGGVSIRTPDGYAVRASGAYDGIGDKDLEAWSAKAGVNIPLQ